MAALCLLVTAAAAACSTTEQPAADCLAAFREAEPRAEPPYQGSPLDDAIRTCTDIVAWRQAWDAVPGAHPGQADPLAFLTERCRLDELESTRLCQSIQ